MIPQLCLLLLQKEKPETYEKRVGTVTVVRTEKTPAIDGVGDDGAWTSAEEFKIGVDLPEKILAPGKSVALKAVHDGDHVYFFLVWKDPTKGDRHEPYVWNKENKVYDIGKDLEDGAFLAFELAGRFNANMRAGVDATWDVWQWKAARTDPVGFAADRLHVFSRKRPEGDAEFVHLLDGKFGYIQRPYDAGKPATVKRPVPRSKQGDVVPRFEAQVPDGSAADVRAKGTWTGGTWTLEFARKIKTGHADDTEFRLGSSCAFAVGVLREAEDEDHFVSMPWTLKFAP